MSTGHGKHESGRVALLLGLFQVIIGGISIYYLIQYCGTDNHCSTTAELPNIGQPLLAVLCIGAVGGCIHGLASLASHQGNENLLVSWRAFYLGRPFIGAGMAMMTYLVLASGVLGFDVKNEPVLLTWSALGGLYSQPALDKLKELFETIFKVQGSDKS